MFDLLIKGGTIINGSGQSRYRADIGIKNGRITAIGNMGDSEHHQTIDATGLYVTPGFIDIHTHSDFTHLVDPRAESQIRQGVTQTQWVISWSCIRWLHKNF
jgi:N-acyl-D-aspartate/D-glutamate deacylase